MKVFKALLLLFLDILGSLNTAQLYCMQQMQEFAHGCVYVLVTMRVSNGVSVKPSNRTLQYLLFRQGGDTPRTHPLLSKPTSLFEDFTGSCG